MYGLIDDIYYKEKALVVPDGEDEAVIVQQLRALLPARLRRERAREREREREGAQQISALLPAVMSVTQS